MKQFLSLLFFLSILGSAESQTCGELSGWSLSTDNGNGTCIYDVSIIVDSGNGASGTTTFSINGTMVFTESNCICNPTTITFPITVACGSAITIDVVYDAPGQGNDCMGSTGSIVLPVEWIELEVIVLGTSNLINWSVEENGNFKYIIEKSQNGENFDQIGEILVEGTNDVLMHYSHIDKEPLAGLNYYRIKQIDYDNSFTYSDITVIRNEELGEIFINPNPFNDKISIKSGNMEYWKLVDIYGNTIMSGERNDVDTDNLTSGMYFLQILDGNSIIHVETLIKA